MQSKRSVGGDGSVVTEHEEPSAGTRETGGDAEQADADRPAEEAAEAVQADGSAESTASDSSAQEAGTGAEGGDESAADSATGGDDSRDGSGKAGAGRKSARAAANAGKRLLRPAVLVPLLLVVLLAGTTAYLGFRLHAVNGLVDARSSAAEAGKRYALDLTTYDYRDLEGNFAAVTSNSTEEFGKQYEEVSGSLTEMIKQYEATSEGTVVKHGVAEATEDRAVLTLFVDQSITNTNTPDPRVDRNRMEMTLVRDDDRWLVQDLKLL